MHALGFTHEQNRYERDEYVAIKWDNIMDGMELLLYMFQVVVSIILIFGIENCGVYVHFDCDDLLCSSKQYLLIEDVIKPFEVNRGGGFSKFVKICVKINEI